jgi:hypothetical protein
VLSAAFYQSNFKQLNIKTMEKSVEKSEQQAEIIKTIAIQIYFLDVEYCREAANDMCNQANRQESMAVLNPNHPQIKNDILRTQGKALLLLCEYVNTLKEVEKLKLQLNNENKNRDEIARMFL